MREHHVGSLVVVEETERGRRPVGIVTVDDLLELLAEQLDGLAKVIAAEQTREARSRA